MLFSAGLSFHASRLYMESCRRYLARVGVHCDIHSQSSKSASNNPAREIEILPPYVSMTHLLFDPPPRGSVKLTACARLNVSSGAFTPAFRSTLTRLMGWKRWSVRTKTPRWLVFRLSICLRKSKGQRSLQTNLMLSRGVWGRGRLALKLQVPAIALANMISSCVCHL